MDAIVILRNGKQYEMDGAKGKIVELTKKLNRHRFLHIGNVIINTAEIESIEFK